MKIKLIEAVTELTKVLWIYVATMAVIITICIGVAMPVLGAGVLVIATLLNIIFGAKIHKGGGDNDSGRNEA